MPGSLRAAPDVVVEELGDELCLYQPETDEVLTLNTTASDVWRLVDGQTTNQQILELLSGAYGVAADAIAADVRGVIEDLLARGFLVESAPE